jgi:sugar lactone lactonase YvrE
MRRLLALLGLLIPLSARCQPLTFNTLAGYSGQGIADGPAASARFFGPAALALDTNGNLYVADSANNTIRKISSAGSVITLAGLPGISGSTDGSNTVALFSQPQGVCVDNSENVYVADTSNDTIRKLSPAGVVTTFAGQAGVSGSANGLGTNALFSQPQGIAVDGAGNVYVADYGNHTVRKITAAGQVSTLAGLEGNFGSADGSGTNAQFYEPQGVAVDAAGNVYVADTANDTIRKVSSSGAVTTGQSR